MKSKIKYFGCALLICLLTATALGGISAAYAYESDGGYYVCFSNQNYAVRNANRMKEENGEFILSNVTISRAIDFYVTDNAGLRWYGKDNAPLKVDESGVYSYDIAFSPDTVYSDADGEWAATDSHLSYRFHRPDSYSVQINGQNTELEYNPYFTSYELYYISSVLDAGSRISYGDEIHTVTGGGYYRILFTPEKRVNNNTYMFDENGNYGSGDDYIFHIAIEDAPVYYAVLLDGAAALGEPDAQIGGANAYSMPRYEKTVVAAEYRTQEFFVPERDGTIKYELYEQNASGAFVRLDDDDKVSRLTAFDAGWYSLSVIDGGDNYAAALKEQERDFGGYYVVGEFNNYGYDEHGSVDVGDEYRFVEVEESDGDYDEDYEQYIIYVNVTESGLRDGDYEFYITDGKDKYKDGGNYISLSVAGRYKILFSAEHSYGRGRNYKYVLEDEHKTGEELNIGSVEQFIKFARNCASSADYSVGLKVYLTADIDFSGVEFVPVGAFSGTFYGGYHKLSNINCTSGAVFTSVNYTATVERLTVENAALGDKNASYVGVVGKNYGTVKYVSVSGTVTGKDFVGGVVGYNGRSDTDSGNSSDVVNKATVTGCTSAADVFGETSVGGVAGHNTGDVISCSSSGRVAGAKNSASATVANLGGIAGYSMGRIYDCAFSGSVTGGDNSRYAGGIAGLCAGEIYFAVNRGNVSAERYAGGIVGYYGMRDGGDTDETDAVSRTNIINYAANYGNVSAQSNVGGVIGRVGALNGGSASVRRLKVYNSASVGDVDATAGSNAGGIVGYGINLEIKSCLSSGTVRAKGLNNGTYVGGIIGYGGDVLYCMSAATVNGEDYVGGIAGYGTGSIVGCYTNALILGGFDAEHTGGIAGDVASFDEAAQKFNGVAGNYYIGDDENSENCGGIAGVDYAGRFDYAAARIERDNLTAAGALPPVLSEDFSREYWQGGADEPSYPTLRNFESAEDCGEFDDDRLWTELFGKYAAEFSALTADSARCTYTVTFLEWNKDNGELYDDDGVLQTDSFEIILSVRVHEGDEITSPALKYATAYNGAYVYEGGKARYFVSLPATVAADGNKTVYALYREIVTSVSSGSAVFAESDFCDGTTVELISVGDYYTLKFMLDGEELRVDNITVKFFAGDDADKFGIVDGNGKVIASKPSGKYVQFVFSSGEYFRLDERSVQLPYWAWLIIGMAIAAFAGGIAWLTVFLVKRRKKNKPAQDEDENKN